MVSYSSSNISINDGHSRRWVHSHTQQQHQRQQQEQKQFVARVHTTYSQVERNKKIMSYGKAQQWQKILDMFQQEQHDYGITNLATTLSQLAKISTFRRDHPYAIYWVQPPIESMNR
jgi:hypothetical protein